MKMSTKINYKHECHCVCVCVSVCVRVCVCADWEKRKDSAGNTLYYDHQHKEVQLERPTTAEANSMAASPQLRNFLARCVCMCVCVCLCVCLCVRCAM